MPVPKPKPASSARWHLGVGIHICMAACDLAWTGLDGARLAVLSCVAVDDCDPTKRPWPFTEHTSHQSRTDTTTITTPSDGPEGKRACTVYFGSPARCVERAGWRCAAYMPQTMADGHWAMQWGNPATAEQHTDETQHMQPRMGAAGLRFEAGRRPGQCDSYGDP